MLQIFDFLLRSVGEVEVVVSVVVVLSLADEGADDVEADWQERDSTPDAHAVVHHVSLNEELASSTVQEVEEPLLGSVRSVVPDVATAVARLLVEVFFTVPGPVLHLGHAQTLSVDESDVLHVSELVVSKSSTYESRINCQLSRSENTMESRPIASKKQAQKCTVGECLPLTFGVHDLSFRFYLLIIYFQG